MLKNVAARVVDGGRRDQYYLATFDALAPACFDEATWEDLDGRTVAGILYAAPD